MMSSSDEYQYSAEHRVRMIGKGCEGFKKINVTVERQSKATGGAKLEIVIKLTDNDDPFFLYTLQLTEEDYKALKSKSGLLVDFDEFVKNFIEFLRVCHDEDHLETIHHRSKLLEFRTDDYGEATLKILDITRFKQSDLIALSLKMGDDDDVKKYLASCVKKLHDELYKKTRQNKEAEDCNSRLMSSISELKIENGKLRAEKETIVSQLTSKYQADIEREQETNKQIQYTLKQNHVQEKDQLEKSFNKQIRELEIRVGDLSEENRQLIDLKKNNEMTINELTRKAQTMSDEYETARNELSRAHSHMSNLETSVQNYQLEIKRLQQSLTMTESSVKEKEERETGLNEKLRQKSSQMNKLEDALRQKRDDLKRKDEELEKCRSELATNIELNKELNHMKQMFQTKDETNKNLINELRSMLKDKETEAHQLKSKSDKKEKKLESYSEQVSKLHRELEEKNKKIEQMEEKLKKNEEMISYYSKRYIDSNLNAASTTTSNGFRPTGSLNSYSSGSNLLPSTNSYIPSNAITSLTNAFDSNLALNINPTSMPVENQQNHEMISPNVGSRVAANPSGNRLEAKYFSTQITQQPMSSATSSMMPMNKVTSLASSSTTSSASMNQQARLNTNNKPYVIAGTNGVNSNQPTTTTKSASLTSAYFPMAN